MQAPALDPKPRPAARNALCLVAIAALACGCNLENAGDEPPPKLLYFANALALPQTEPGVAPRYLFAANSNYDLRYKAGTVMAISLDAVRAQLDENAGQPAFTIDPASVIEDEAFIGSYSTALGLAPDGRTLFVATRTDDSLTFVHVDSEAGGDDVLRCADGDEGRECSSFATRATDPNTGDALDWPPDPTSIIVRPLAELTGDDADGDALAAVVSHRDGFVSLFTQDGDGFELVDVLSGLGPLTGLNFEANSGLVFASVGFSGVARIGVATDEGASPTLYNAGSVRLYATSTVPLARDIAFFPQTENEGAISTQDNALVVAQNPDALLLVALSEPGVTDPSRSLRVLRTAVLGQTCYRVVTGQLDGKPIALVSCLDSRELYVIDLATMLPLTVVPHLSGPFDIALDEVRQLVYVADYHSSVIRVIDLAPVVETAGEQPARLAATIGEPRVIQELK